MTGFAVVIAVAAAAWPLLPRRYESTASVIMRPTDEEGRFDRGQSLRQPLDESAIQSEMDLMGSPAIAATVIARHQLAIDPEFGRDPNNWKTTLSHWARENIPLFSGAAETPATSNTELRQTLQKHLNISRDRRSYTVKLGYWSSDPVKAAAMTETLLSAYLEDQSARKRRLTEKFSDGLTERVESLRAKQGNSERAVSQFMAASDLVDSATQTSLENQLSALGREAAEARTRYINATTRTELQKNMVIDGASEVRSSSFEPSAKESNAVEATRSVAWLRDNRLVVQSPGLPANPEAEAKGWAAKEAVLRRAMKAIREELASRRQAELKLEQLRQEAATDKSVLDAALTRLKEQAVRTATLGPDVEILAHPEAPIRPIFPDPLLAIIGTFFAACLAGAAMIWRPLSIKARHILAAH
ncbi:GumC family protein [Microvirga alba]|uniref:Polysaccharide chain length determinant N-terminal domain-containing protein n=1 Tax=Microvirga alba TaxID=2791025 RepID=A0A931BP52_9HYPH|nr:hypothetical protein [Microvirga alba]MBF9234416.1 hypothetical protein [Microvirga alba]